MVSAQARPMGAVRYNPVPNAVNAGMWKRLDFDCRVNQYDADVHGPHWSCYPN